MVNAEKLRSISPQDLALLGSGQVVYVRPVVVDDATRYVITGADGTRLGIAPDYNTAIVAALEHDFRPVSLH